MQENNKSLLMNAREEILRLRRQNEVLRARVETMDLFALVFHTRPAYPSEGVSVDVAWELQREIDAINGKQAALRGDGE